MELRTCLSYQGCKLDTAVCAKTPLLLGCTRDYLSIVNQVGSNNLPLRGGILYLRQDYTFAWIPLEKSCFLNFPFSSETAQPIEQSARGRVVKRMGYAKGKTAVALYAAKAEEAARKVEGRTCAVVLEARKKLTYSTGFFAESTKPQPSREPDPCAPPSLVCAVCGSDEARQRCGQCKAVTYCG